MSFFNGTGHSLLNEKLELLIVRYVLSLHETRIVEVELLDTSS